MAAVIDLDRFSGLDSPVHRLEPRCRLVGCMALIASFAVVRSGAVLIPMLGVAAALVAASGLPWGFIMRRLRAPMLMVLALGLVLVTASGGELVARLGPVPISSAGLRQLVVIVAKLMAIGAVALVLFGTAPLATTVVAMRRLGLPSLLADMMVFSFRALHEIGTDLRTMRTAAGMRGVSWHRRRRGVPSRLGTLAQMVGSLFVISHARAEHVHRAMLLRGYSGDAPLGPARRVDAASAGFVVLAVFAAAALVMAEWSLGTVR
jgi:cobalt/nickel transport system permease protein